MSSTSPSRAAAPWLRAAALLVALGAGATAAQADPACAGEECTTRGLSAAHGDVKGADGALALLRAGCAQGQAAACAQVTLVAHARGAEPAAAPPPSEGLREPHAAACDTGAMPACLYLGVSLQQGWGGAADPEGALALYKKACNGNVARACYLEGELHAAGPAAFRDPLSARELYGQACNGGELDACLALGRVVERSPGAEAASRAASWYERGCEGGHGASCGELLRLYGEGRIEGVTPEAVKALKVKACAAGHTPSCG